MLKRGKNLERGNYNLLRIVDKVLYWIGLVIAVVGVFKNLFFILIGIFIMLLSLIFYKLSFKLPIESPKTKKAKKRAMLINKIIQRLQKVKQAKKSKKPVQIKKTTKPGRQVKPTKPSKPNKSNELTKLSTPKTYYILFFISLFILIITLISHHLITFILGVILMSLSLLGHRLKHKPSKEKPSKKKEINLTKLNIKRGRYETDFDVLYNLVQKRKNIKFSEIEEYFKISKVLVEEWCSILENHGLLKVYYPPFGEPELRTKDFKEPENTKKLKTNKNPKSTRKGIIKKKV